MKICSRCSIEKDINEFSKDSHIKSGVKSCCKSCEKEYRHKNKEKILDRNKEYRRNNRQKLRDYWNNYNKKEDRKQKKKEYQKIYESKPEVKAKRKEYMKEWKQKNRRKQHLQSRYNITIDKFKEMEKKQNNCCAICRTVSNKILHIDHNHNTGEVRGLLCKRCNFGLGFFDDNIKYIESALTYLKESSEG